MAGTDTDDESAGTLQDQLTALERIALLAGMTRAADWIRDHHAHSVVWVHDADWHPVKMFTWLAKERNLDPITCSVCGRVATEVDNSHPYFTSWDRCAAHLND